MIAAAADGRRLWFSTARDGGEARYQSLFAKAWWRWCVLVAAVDGRRMQCSEGHVYDGQWRYFLSVAGSCSWTVLVEGEDAS